MESSACTFQEYLDNDSNDVTVIHVSRGFSFPRLLERSEDHQPDDHHTQSQIPDYPATYACRSILVSTYTSSEGAKFVFYISKGVHFTPQSVVPVQDPATEIPDWIYGIIHDAINFTVRSVDLRQVGLEDDHPNGFSWCERGVDVEFRPQESIPLKHLMYFSHGGLASSRKLPTQVLRNSLRTRSQRFPVAHLGLKAAASESPAAFVPPGPPGHLEYRCFQEN